MAKKSDDDDLMRLDPTRVVIGSDSNEDTRVMVMTLPIALYATDFENGEALLRGQIDIFKAKAIMKMAELRRKAAGKTLIQPPAGLSPKLVVQ